MFKIEKTVLDKVKKKPICEGDFLIVSSHKIDL